MRKLTHLSIILFASTLMLNCKKKVEENIIYDNIVYDVDNVEVYSSNAQKTKQKSAELLISIMYADVYQQGITTNTLLELSEIYLSLGDKTMFNELVFSHFFKDPLANVPTNTQMRADVEQFVNETYLKFYQRNPSEYEKRYLVNLINDDANITVENVYTSIVLSNEYYFY